MFDTSFRKSSSSFVTFSLKDSIALLSLESFLQTHFSNSMSCTKICKPSVRDLKIFTTIQLPVHQ